MKFPQNILVIVSGKRRNHIALARALQFAEFYDIKLTLLSCVFDPGTELSPLLSSNHKKQIKEQKIQERQEYLEQLKSNIESKNIPVQVMVKWNRKIQRAVMEACDELKPDLVVKRISESANSVNPFTMPMDWQLLRYCPAPLLLVKSAEWNMNAPTLAAIDAASENPKEQAFNRDIINFAKLIGRLTNAPTHAVTTHISPMIDNAITIPGFDPNQLKEEVNALNRKKLAELVSDMGIQPQNQHVIEGLAENRIPELSKQINSQIVVMGTISRDGIKGAFMGNTAERVLTHLQCEVLALKP
ncbi:universal stress protein UspE [Aliikangiella sp. G2MR2-5]|uniref:universal stress protein UspE n=1 Tax=Aliikangiella sp. G2MR2-5 TaxID=2788943 RepID=UPI0018AC024A|nr:universal stress protein UspE [Aliikangiella sp. G2MR2-5]